MDKELTVNVFEKVGSEAAVSSEDGDLLFKLMDNAFQNNVVVTLDFGNVKILTSTFLNSAIGQLYSKYKSDFLNEHVKISNLSNGDRKLLIKVIERAKEYFENKNKIENSIKISLE